VAASGVFAEQWLPPLPVLHYGLSSAEVKEFDIPNEIDLGWVPEPKR
jgi:hypothetical protein